MTPAEINEGEIATLSGNFVDVGVDDSFALSVDWRDGSPTQTIPLAAGTQSFSVPHRFLDDAPLGTSSDLLTPDVTLADKDGGTTDGSFVSRTVSFTNPSVISSGGGKLNNLDGYFTEDNTWVEAFADGTTTFSTGSLSIASGGYLMQRNSGSSVRGLFIQAADGAAFTLSSLDYRLVATTSLPGFSSSDVKVLVSRTFDPTMDALQMQQFSIGSTVQSTFSTLGFGSQFTNVTGLFIASSASVDFDNIVIRIGSVSPSVRVDNIPPQNLGIDAGDSALVQGAPVTLTASATDPGGAADPITYAWLISYAGAPYDSGSGSEFIFTPTDPGTYDVTLTAADDDLGVSTLEKQITVAPALMATGAAVSLADGAPQIALTFTEPPQSLDAGDLSITAQGGGAAGPADHVTFDPNTNTATFIFDSLIADGVYRATVPAGAVTDVAGHSCLLITPLIF